jgi:hypothetical protein
MPEFFEDVTLKIPVHAGKPKSDGRRFLTSGNVVAYATVLDDPFGRSLAVVSWSFSSKGYPSRDVRMPNGKRKFTSLHQEVFRNYNEPLPKGMTIDHINRDKLNNLPSNLRPADNVLQHLNWLREVGSSGYRGVCLETYSNGNLAWRARVRCVIASGKKRFPFTEEGKIQAARWVNKFYRDNFPELDFIPNPSVEE